MFKLSEKNYCPIAKDNAIIFGKNYRITILSEGLVRFEYSEEGVFLDECTTTVVNRNFPEVEYNLYRDNAYIYIETSKFKLKYNELEPHPMSLQVSIKSSGAIWHYGDENSAQYKFHNLGGTIRTLDTVNGSTDIGQGILSRQGYAIIDDSKSCVIDNDGWFIPRATKQIDLYIFAHGLEYQDTLDDFFILTGNIPLLPRFAFGNWWSRYHAYTDIEYKDLIQKFSDYEIPLSVAVIDMDWHITDVDPKYGSGWTGYTWNNDLFPDPEEFLQWLHDAGLKTTLNIHPADGIRPFESQYEAMCEYLNIDPQLDESIEFDLTNKEFVKAYLEIINHDMEDMGVDSWWLDWQQGTISRMEGLDPLWPLNHFYYLDSENNNIGKRGLIFSRYAGLGSHRYPVGFSGDTVISWESLDFQPYFTSRSSNVGYTWWSHDIGGHMNGRKDDELQVRWIQLGVFSPILRLHSSSNPFLTREPWKYGEITKNCMISALRLRHRLIPYLYSMNFLSAYKNIPLVRPLYFDNPLDPHAYDVKNEYYFGSELIVCPITNPLDTTTLMATFHAWIPIGDYFDFFNGRHYVGGKAINLNRNIYETPVLAKAGAIIPMDNNEKLENTPANPRNLLLKIFTGCSGKFDLIEDKGNKIRPEISELAITTIEYEYNYGIDAKLKIKPVNGDSSAIPKLRNLSIELYGVEDTSLYLEDNDELIISDVNYKEVENILSFKINNYNVNSGLSIVIANAEIAENDFLQTAFNLLDAMQFDYDMKAEIYHIIKVHGNSASSFSELKANPKYPQNVIAILEELYYAAN